MADNPPTASSPGGLPTPVHWPRVKEILDCAIADWRAANNNRVPKLKQRHGPAFGWDTKADLLAATAVIGGQTYRLIDPGLAAQQKGAETNLIKALRDPDGVDGNGQMPNGGPYLTDTHPTFLDEILSWINGGMPG
jgi:hypothetical protein